MKIIDLTHSIHEGMTTFPVYWHPPVEITQLARHGIENRETRKVVLGTHTGTHIDAPCHFIPGGDTLEKIPLDLLIGPARLLNFAPSKPKQEIGIADLSAHLGNEKPERLILRFDWSDYWGTMSFYTQQPFLSEDAAHWLVERGVRLIAMDTPQLDSPDNGRTGPKDSPLHKLLLGAGVVFVECCTNLRQISQTHLKLVVLPLKLLHADGAPCRAVAIEN